MLGLPIYLRGSTYYLHTRINGQQVKRTLGTSDKLTAILRASKIIEALGVGIKKYEIDIGRGIFKADGPEDHQRLLEALALVTKAQGAPQAVSQAPQAPQVHHEAPAPQQKGLKLKELLSKFFLLKSHLKEATVVSYTATIEELAQVLRNPVITNVSRSDVSRFQEALAKKGNTPRTIDAKVGTVRAIFNFAIEQGYYFDKNPAENRALQSKKDKLKGGYAIFTADEIKLIYKSDFMRESQEKDPDYYWTLVLGLITGCRISEITGITAEQFLKSGNIHYIKIDDSKTLAGVREIPIPTLLMKYGLVKFLEGKKGQVFKYKLRLGKGSGNAVGKKFSRHLEELKITRDKLVFHSLRKFSNDFMMKNDIPLEARCQFFGHEIDSVNVQVYTKKLEIEELAAKVSEVQSSMMVLGGLMPTKFDAS